MAFLRHGGDDLRRAFARAFRIAVGRELGRRLHQAGENGRFAQRRLSRAMPEIPLARGLHAIGAGAEIDAVEIEFEDLVLRVAPLQPQREDRLLDLAAERALLRQEQVLGELLGQRRAALHPAAAFRHVGDDRPADAHRVDAPMRVEAPVLDGDEGLRQIGRQFGEPDGRAAGVAAIGEHVAVDAENGDVRRALGHGKLVDRRQLRGVIGEHAGRRDRAPPAQHQNPVDELAGKRARAPPAPRLRAPAAVSIAFLAAHRCLPGIGAQIAVRAQARLAPAVGGVCACARRRSGRRAQRARSLRADRRSRAPDVRRAPAFSCLRRCPTYPSCALSWRRR